MAVTLYGVTALTFMMLMYALEKRGPGFIAAFAVGCALSSAYGFLCRRLAVRRGRSGLGGHRGAPLLSGARLIRKSSAELRGTRPQGNAGTCRTWRHGGSSQMRKRAHRKPSSIKLLNWADYLSADAAEGLRGRDRHPGRRDQGRPQRRFHHAGGGGRTLRRDHADRLGRRGAAQGGPAAAPRPGAAAQLGAGHPAVLPGAALRPGYPRRKYTSVCYFGTEGFAVRLDRIALPPKSWQMLYDPDLRRTDIMLDGSREVLGPALFLLGADPNMHRRRAARPGRRHGRRPETPGDHVRHHGAGSPHPRRHAHRGVLGRRRRRGDHAGRAGHSLRPAQRGLPRLGRRALHPGQRLRAGRGSPLSRTTYSSPTWPRRTPTSWATSPSCRRPTRWCAASCSAPCGRPTSRSRAGTFLRDLGEFNATFDASYAKVRVA